PVFLSHVCWRLSSFTSRRSFDLYMENQSDIIKRMVDEGHIIGNRSWSYPDMTTMSNDQIRQELAKVRDGVAAISSQKSMQYLRRSEEHTSELQSREKLVCRLLHE